MDAYLEDSRGKIMEPVKHGIPKSKLTGSTLLQTAVCLVQGAIYRLLQKPIVVVIVDSDA